MATIAYADVIDHYPLPIDAQDIATRVRMTVAGTRAGKEPSSYRSYYAATSGGAYTHMDYIPLPIVHETSDALDSTYHAEKVEPIPDGLSPFLAQDDAAVPEPTVTTGVTLTGTPSEIRDNDPSTYAVNSGTGIVQLEYNTTGHGYAVGFYLRYHAAFSGGGPISYFTGPGGVILQQLNGGYPQYSTVATYDCVAADDPVEIYAIFPWDARGAAENGGPGISNLVTYITLLFDAGSFAASGDLKIYDFYPLFLDNTFLEGIGGQYIKLPASSPKRVTVRGYVAPDASHTITGWPGGDYTGTPSRHTYGGGVTVIDFEQAGAPVGMPQEAAQVATYQNHKNNRTAALKTYAVRMGQRS